MDVDAGPLKGNIRKLYAFSVLKMTLFPMAVITLFWKDQIGLSLTEILLLQAIFSVACIVMEYPSGYLSDRIGYRSALILACLLAIAGWSFYTIATSFAGVLLAEIILGAAWAFISGSDTALLFETLRARGLEGSYARFDGRITGAAQTGEAAGALFAGVMYAAWPLMPFIFQIGIWIICLILCISMVEPPQESEAAIRSHLAEALRTCRYAFLDNRHIRATILFGALLGLASFYTVWLIQPYMQETGVPLAWFGPAWAGANLTVALFSLISHRLHFGVGHFRHGGPLHRPDRCRLCGAGPDGDSGKLSLLLPADRHARPAGTAHAQPPAAGRAKEQQGQHPVPAQPVLPRPVCRHRPPGGLGRRSSRPATDLRFPGDGFHRYCCCLPPGCSCGLCLGGSKARVVSKLIPHFYEISWMIRYTSIRSRRDRSSVWSCLHPR